MDERNQKVSLLQHTRLLQEKRNSKRKVDEEAATTELETQKKKSRSKETEITRLTQGVESEAAGRKRAEKECQQLKKDSSARIAHSEDEVKRLQEEIKSLQNTISEHESLEAEINRLRSQTEELQAGLKTPDDTQKKKVALEADVTSLQENLAKAESRASAKDEEFRNMLIRHFGGVAISLGWQECLNFSEAQFTELKESLRQNLAKLNKRTRRLQTEHHARKTGMVGDEQTPSPIHSVQQRKASPIYSVQQRKASPESHSRRESFRHSAVKPRSSSQRRISGPMPIKSYQHRHSRFEAFRVMLSRRIEHLYFRLYRDAESLASSLSQSDAPAHFRGCIGGLDYAANASRKIRPAGGAAEAGDRNKRNSVEGEPGTRPEAAGRRDGMPPAPR
jgi:hypothetical protein